MFTNILCYLEHLIFYDTSLNKELNYKTNLFEYLTLAREPLLMWKAQYGWPPLLR
jgi:hypothetical protein